VIPLHSKTGLHYTHLVPTCPAYRDTARMLGLLAARCAWMSVEPVEAFAAIQDSAEERRTCVLWGGAEHSEPRGPDSRQCRLALVYCETLGDPDLLHSDQRAVLERFQSRVGRYDLVLWGTRDLGAGFSKLGTFTRGSAFALASLAATKNAVMLAVTSDAGAQAEVVSAAVSYDEGSTWSSFADVADVSAGGGHLTAVRLAASPAGTISLVYSVESTGTRRGVFVADFD